MNFGVIHVITTIDLGGAEKQLLTLATCQKEKGLDVEVIFLKGMPVLLNDFCAAGIRVETRFAKMNFYRQLWELWALRKRTNKVFHAHLPRAELLCAFSLKKGAFLITRHNSEQFFPKAPKFISILLSRFVLHRAFASISISKAVSAFLINAFEMSVKTKNHVIYYGLPKINTDTAIKNQHDATPFHIGTISRHVPQKNIPLLLNLFKRLTEEETFHGKLSIVGAGPLTNELKVLSQHLGIDNLVTWIGQAKEVEDFYKSLDLFVLTSSYEGFGLVLLEAMQQGTPVIARAVSSIPEVLGKNHPGLVDSLHPDEYALKILEMYKNRELLRECTRFQFARLNNFSIDNTEFAHRKLYDCLLVEGN